jgi:hypothetical protein
MPGLPKHGSIIQNLVCSKRRNIYTNCAIKENVKLHFVLHMRVIKGELTRSLFLWQVRMKTFDSLKLLTLRF